eukprot:scaffold6393_cov60-Phaeocystis_antarctica.AAC.1
MKVPSASRSLMMQHAERADDFPWWTGRHDGPRPLPAHHRSGRHYCDRDGPSDEQDAGEHARLQTMATAVGFGTVLVILVASARVSQQQRGILLSTVGSVYSLAFGRDEIGDISEAVPLSNLRKGDSVIARKGSEKCPIYIFRPSTRYWLGNPPLARSGPCNGSGEARGSKPRANIGGVAGGWWVREQMGYCDVRRCEGGLQRAG